MSDDTVDEGGYVSPPIRVAVTSGYRVGALEDGEICYVEIIENSTEDAIAMARGHYPQEAEERAKMIVACLNRVPR